MLGLEGRRQLVQRFPHVQLSELQFHELWDYLDQAFLVERNITVEQVKFLSRRQRPPETLEQYHAALTGLAAECRLGNLEDEIIRDVFISNIDHPELQGRFCIKMLSPMDLLREIQAYERGVGDQQTLARCPMGSVAHTSDTLTQPGPLTSRPRRNPFGQFSPTVALAAPATHQTLAVAAPQKPALMAVAQPTPTMNHVATAADHSNRDTAKTVQPEALRVAPVANATTSHACADPAPNQHTKQPHPIDPTPAPHLHIRIALPTDATHPLNLVNLCDTSISRPPTDTRTTKFSLKSAPSSAPLPIHSFIRRHPTADSPTNEAAPITPHLSMPMTTASSPLATRTPPAVTRSLLTMSRTH